jgi:hypothetical protein
MTQALAKHQPQVSLVKGNLDLGDLQLLGKTMAESGYFTDTKSAAQAMVKILAGREYGFDPITAMSNIHIINGKPSLSATAQAAVIKSSGKYNYRILHTDTVRCEVEFYERFGDKFEPIGKSSFTKQEAETAQLTRNPNWSKYPADMLFARAITRGMRRYCPDLLRGEVVESDFMPEPIGDIAPVEETTGFMPNESPAEFFAEAETVDNTERLENENIAETLLSTLCGDDAAERKKILKGRIPSQMTDENLVKLIDELQSI